MTCREDCKVILRIVQPCKGFIDLSQFVETFARLSKEAQMTSAIMAFLHHLAAFTLDRASLIYELTTFRKDLSLAGARQNSTDGYPLRDLRRVYF